MAHLFVANNKLDQSKSVKEKGEFNDKILNDCRNIAKELGVNESQHTNKLDFLLEVAGINLLAVKTSVKTENSPKTAENSIRRGSRDPSKILDLIESKEPTILPEALTKQLKYLFKALIPLHKYHRLFLRAIYPTIETLHLGQAVKDKSEFVGSYGEYLFTWERLTSQGGFPFWIRTNDEVAKVMNHIESELQSYPYFDKNTKRLGVLNLFDCVFKKWVQYKLLVERYEKKLPKVWPDKKKAKEAVIQLKKAGQQNNEYLKNRCNLEILERVGNKNSYPLAFKEGNELIATGNAMCAVSEHHVDVTMKHKVNSEKYKTRYYIWIENHLLKAKQSKQRPEYLIIEKDLEIDPKITPEILKSPGGHRYMRFHLANATKTSFFGKKTRSISLCFNQMQLHGETWHREAVDGT